ncbi:permease [Nisaea nitritireducens]|uniref:permease n=1 Tax=Nisaea nitritireducens TaxID=568392 RepID=UPI001D00A1EA|nr:permease [Nisaea nitritireducens]
MSDCASTRPTMGRRTIWTFGAIFATLLGLALVFPSLSMETFQFVGWSLLEVSPLVIPGVLLSAWVRASGASGRISEIFRGNMHRTVLAAAAVGAVTPVCGISVLPLMVGLLAGGVPLAPVMAFWLSSPVTDPAMLATTAATLGVEFAVGKTLAAFCIGLAGGSLTAMMAHKPWAMAALRDNSIVGSLGQVCQTNGFTPAIWKDAENRTGFYREIRATTRLILICLIPAFAMEHLLGYMLTPEALSAYVGSGNWWSIPLAVLIGGPLYLDGFAALPLTRSLLDHGMSPGAAMGFLVSGGVVSIYGAMAILPVLKLKPFLLYLIVALTGSLAAGWAFDMIM